MTNLDWLKTLDRSEMAEFLDEISHAWQTCPPEKGVCNKPKDCRECWLSWLEEEACTSD